MRATYRPRQIEDPRLGQVEQTLERVHGIEAAPPGQGLGVDFDQLVLGSFFDERPQGIEHSLELRARPCRRDRARSVS